MGLRRVFLFILPPGADTNDVNALEALKAFYASKPTTEYTDRPIHLLDHPNFVMQVSDEAAKKFLSATSDTTLADYLAPINSNALNGGFSLSKLLSMDIVANSVADDFARRYTSPPPYPTVTTSACRLTSTPPVWHSKLRPSSTLPHLP